MRTMNGINMVWGDEEITGDLRVDNAETFFGLTQTQVNLLTEGEGTVVYNKTVHALQLNTGSGFKTITNDTVPIIYGGTGRTTLPTVPALGYAAWDANGNLPVNSLITKETNISSNTVFTTATLAGNIYIDVASATNFTITLPDIGANGNVKPGFSFQLFNESSIYVPVQTFNNGGTPIPIYTSTPQSVYTFYFVAAVSPYWNFTVGPTVNGNTDIYNFNIIGANAALPFLKTQALYIQALPTTNSFAQVTGSYYIYAFSDPTANILNYKLGAIFLPDPGTISINTTFTIYFFGTSPSANIIVYPFDQITAFQSQHNVNNLNALASSQFESGVQCTLLSNTPSTGASAWIITSITATASPTLQIITLFLGFANIFPQFEGVSAVTGGLLLAAYIVTSSSTPPNVFLPLEPSVVNGQSTTITNNSNTTIPMRNSINTTTVYTIQPNTVVTFYMIDNTLTPASAWGFSSQPTLNALSGAINVTAGGTGQTSVGSAGQFLQTLGDGTTQWAAPPSAGTSWSSKSNNTALTVADTVDIYLSTGCTSITLPVTSTLTLGRYFNLMNGTSGNITVFTSNGSTVVTVLPGNTSEEVWCVLTSGTTAASWFISN